MAKTQEVKTEEQEVKTEETRVYQPMPPYNPWEDMRQVYVPKRSRGEQSTLEVGVNDKTYFVPKDRFVEVPAPVWEVINEMQKQQRALENYLSTNDNLTPSAGKG